MDRFKRLFQAADDEQAYEPLVNSETLARDGEEEHESAGGRPSQQGNNSEHARGFYIEYSIFLLLGISMLWAWNMFLAAGPYFQHRFRSNEWIYNNFQAAELSVSTITNLSSMLILTRLQAGANYPKRIVVSLVINLAVFGLLAVSTAVDTSAGVYFAFLMLMIFATSLATGFCQNGVFAYVSGFAEPRFTQGIMTGQAVAGVLPCIAQIVSVLTVQGGDDATPPQVSPPVRWTAALSYFVTAVVISLVTLLAFGVLLARNKKPAKFDSAAVDDLGNPSEEGKSVPLLHLFKKLFWLASGVFITFAITMVFPVFTQRIVSVRPPAEQPPILRAPSFIPLALLFWNSGDLIGRLLTAVQSLSLVSRPKIIFALAIGRIAWVGFYHLCNIHGQGAIVSSDFFYLVAVQLLFGLSNGYVGSICMIGAGVWADESEREAAGGFMGLCLVAGLTAGSLLSFFITGS
jgi:equilibrative nucleoside transporter 1/2/3